MNPVVGLIAVQVISGLAQYYQAEKARGAQQKELDKIKNIFDSIKPVDLAIDVEDDPEYLKFKIPETQYEMQPITPDALRVVGQFNPEIANYVQEQAPQLIEESVVSREGLAAQRDALEKMRDVARGGFDPEFQQRQNEAAQRAQIEAQSRQQSALQQAQRRGAGPASGMALATALQGGSDAMQRQGMMQQAAASDAYRNQLDAVRQSANMGQNLRSQDFNMQKNNANVINDFNQRMSQGYQKYLDTSANMRNSAQLKNLGERQRVSEENVRTGNEARKNQQSRMDRIKERQRAERVGERQAYLGAKRDEANNRMDIARGRAGVGGMQSDMYRQNAQDNNRAIQSLGDLGSTYFQGQREDERFNEAQNREDARTRERIRQEREMEKRRKQQSQDDFSNTTIGPVY
jgi:hypothetical protein